MGNFSQGVSWDPSKVQYYVQKTQHNAAERTPLSGPFGVPGTMVTTFFLVFNPGGGILVCVLAYRIPTMY